MSVRVFTKNVGIRTYRPVIFPAVARMCLCRTFGEECRLRVIENRVLREILGHKWQGATGD